MMPLMFAEPTTTSAGPGHIPTKPQPIPKIELPTTSFLSILSFVDFFLSKNAGFDKSWISIYCTTPII